MAKNQPEFKKDEEEKKSEQNKDAIVEVGNNKTEENKEPVA